MSVTENVIVVVLRYQWDHQILTQGKPQSVIASPFREFKAFSACLKPQENSDYCQLILLTNLKIVGLKALSAKVTCSTLKFENDDMKTKPTDFKDEFSTGGLQIFVKSVKILQHKVQHTYNFSIRATSCVANYRIRLIDSLLKEEMRLSRHQRQSDFVLLVNKNSFPCHKAILAARSSVFLNKFIADPNLSQAEIIDPLATTNDVDQFLEFLYTGQFKKPLISKQLFLLAKSFEVRTLVDLCEYAQREITLVHLMNFAIQEEPFYQPTKGSAENHQLPSIVKM